MATHLARSSFPVTGYDINPATLKTLDAAGGKPASSPADAAATTKATVAMFMVATADHLNSALFTPKEGAVHGLAKDATLIIHSTVPPTMIPELRQKLASEYGRDDLILIDAPVSGGVARAKDGTLSIMVSSESPSDLERPDVKTVLDCVAATVYLIPGGLGSALTLKALNQVLCGIHIATTGEIMGLAAVLGVDPRKFIERLNGPGPNKAAGKGKSWAWMLEDRAVRTLDPSPPLSSAIIIIFKYILIVNAEGERAHVPLRLCNAAQVVYERAVALGLERADDSAVIEVYLRENKDDDKLQLWRERSKSGGVLHGEEEDKLIKKLEIAVASIYSMATYEALLFAEGKKMCESEEQIKQWYDILANAAGGSTMFINGMPKLLKSVSQGGKNGVELLVPTKEGLLNTLVSVNVSSYTKMEPSADKVREQKEVTALAQKQNYTPTLLLVAEQYFQQISDGTFTHDGSPVKLVDSFK